MECQDSETFADTGTTGYSEEGRSFRLMTPGVLLLAGAFFTSVRLDSLNSLQTSGKGLAWPTASQVTQCLLICCYTFIQVSSNVTCERETRKEGRLLCRASPCPGARIMAVTLVLSRALTVTGCLVSH